ncbi:tRNA(Ile)-lysidine synthetase, N-terminal domain [Levilinea saccharolytica]|nr:tRNA(Ile)-lysidine synthetase, N-terminal domain [Levilinea saccharolytica]
MRLHLVKTCKLDASALTLVGVSGGADSLSLWGIMVEAGFQTAAVHVRHGLRPEAEAEAERVVDWGRKWGVRVMVEDADVRGTAASQHLSVEEAARKLRYQALFGQAQRLGAQAVAVGHTADDQVETVLMHLLRGAGMAGLRGMAARMTAHEWESELPLVRPLLGVWRAETEAWCQARGLEPVQDASNADTTYFRNRLRHELLPYLAEYNPQIKERLWRTAAVLAADYALVEERVQHAWEDCLIRAEPGWVRLRADGLRAAPLGVQRGIIRRAVGWLRPGLRDFDFSQVEQAVGLIQQDGETGGLELTGGLEMRLRYGEVQFIEPERRDVRRNYPQMEAGSEVVLSVPGEVPLGGGWILAAAAVEEVPQNLGGDPWEAWLDLEQVRLPLRVRTGRPGERFCPFGMGGHSQKLSDFWVNQRVPREARAGWPLVCSADEIAWIPGGRTAEFCRVSETTRRWVHLRLSRNPAEG